MNDLQRAARTRKLIYLAAILGLFTLSMFWRGVLDLPFGNPNAPDFRAEVARRLNLRASAPDFDAAVADRLKLDAGSADFRRQVCERLNIEYRGGFARVLDATARLPIVRQAENLELRELDMGDPEIAGSAARVSLVGFRGVVVTSLWSSAIEKQKRNEWHDFELYARLVTRLQPNFITPWLYQGWNIAYNVSVENENLGDMFFYIARGIELLSEGDKLNTKIVRRRGEQFVVGSPDLRREIAFFYQNKFTVSDKVTTLRCLMQLSVMKPADRSPTRILKQGSTEVIPEEFLRFCQENPQLARRLATPRPNPTLGKDVTDTIAGTPAAVADFLAANAELPTRWEKNGTLKSPDAQFPTLPPDFANGTEYHPGHPALDDRYDALLAARAWFQYAQIVVPPPPKDGLAAAAPKRPSEWDPDDPDAQYKYRMPQYPSLIIFRYYPARAQTYLAERLQKEGWYDETSEWNPDATVTGAAWFPGRVVGLKAARNSRAEWQEAFNRWKAYGEANGMNPTPAQMAEMEDAYKRTALALPQGTQLDSEEAQRRVADGLVSPRDLRLRKALLYLPQNLQVTNFRYFYDSSKAEQGTAMVDARKGLTEAERLRATGGLGAKAAYADAIARWRQVLQSNFDYHSGDRSDSVHEFTFEVEQKLIDLWKDEPVVTAHVDEAMMPALRAAVPFVVKAEQGQTPAPFANVYKLAREDYLQAVGEDRALTQIAVRKFMLDNAGVSEAKAWEAVTGPEKESKFAYTRVREDGVRVTVSWVRPDIREQKLQAAGLRRVALPPPAVGPDGQPPMQMPQRNN